MSHAASQHFRSIAALAPALVFLAVCFLLPLGYTLALAFIEPVPGFDNFIRLFNPVYLGTFASSFEIAITVSLLSLIIAYPTALLIVSCPPRWSAVMLALVIVPFFTSVLVRNYAWLFLLGRRGVINSALMSAGIIDQPLALMYNRFGVLVGMTHSLAPYLILLLIATLRALDPNLVRASFSLRAGPFATFRQVTLPLSLSGAGAGTILVFVLALAFFITPAMLGSPQDAMIANAISSEIGFLNWGFAATLGMGLLVITLAAVTLMQRLFGGLSLIAPSIERKRETRARWSMPSWLDTVLYRLDAVLNPVWPVVVTVAGILTIAFLVLPVTIAAPLSFSSSSYFTFPPPGWTLRWYEAFFADARWTGATLNSIVIGLMTVLLSLLLAVPAALGIARSKSRVVLLAYLVIISPIIVPTILTAISVLFGFTRVGLARNMFGIALGHTIGALPLAVVTLVAAFSNFDWSLERAAQSLGATRATVLRRVVFPLILPSLATAAFLVFLHSFDDLLVSLFLGGVRLETLPRRMWESLQEISPVIAAVSTMLIVFMVMLLVLVQLLQARQARRTRGRAA